jgi:hypothetical protein
MPDGVGWQGYVRANVRTPREVRTLATSAEIGPLKLTPTGILRHEPDVDGLDPVGLRTQLVSSPISVDGRVSTGEASSHHVGGLARNHMWRACVLLHLALDQPYWPMAEPTLHVMVDVGKERVPEDHPSVAHFDASQYEQRVQRVEKPNLIHPPDWLKEGWAALEQDAALEQLAQLNLVAAHHLMRGHMEAELALLGLVAVFDAIGERLNAEGSRKRVLASMRRSFEILSGPLGDPARDAERLCEATYSERNRVVHEGSRMLLVGGGSGALGDKRGDLDGLNRWVETADVGLLARQARVLVASQLGLP